MQRKTQPRHKLKQQGCLCCLLPACSHSVPKRFQHQPLKGSGRRQQGGQSGNFGAKVEPAHLVCWLKLCKQLVPENRNCNQTFFKKPINLAQFLFAMGGFPISVVCLPRASGVLTMLFHRKMGGDSARSFAAESSYGNLVPPPPCISYALVQATVGVGTVLIWDLILIRYQTQCSHIRHGFGDGFASHIESRTHLL